MQDFIDVLDADGCLRTEILGTRRFMANGVRFDNLEGEQCYSDAANIAYLGMMALVRPSVFLSLVSPERIQSTDYMASTPNPYGSPYLEVRIPHDDSDVPVIREHEGRSRMSAILRNHGDLPMPICMFFSVNGYALRAREIEPEWIERVAAGVIRERRNTPPEWVAGPVMEQVVYMRDGVEPHHMDFRQSLSPTRGLR